jgi:hypothetical protein
LISFALKISLLLSGHAMTHVAKAERVVVNGYVAVLGNPNATAAKEMIA